MRAYKVETTLQEDGVLERDALPFRAGDAIEVISVFKLAVEGRSVNIELLKTL